MRTRHVDRVFLLIVVILTVVGFFIFVSAALGLLARNGASFSSVATSQIFLGLILGSIGLLVASNVHYKHLKRYSLYIFIFSLFATFLVFIPGLGFEYNGAKRWIGIASFSIQPAEFLKLGFVIYFAAWLSGIRDKLHSFTYSVVPFVVLSCLIAVPLLLQPDTGTVVVILTAGLAMFIAAGARVRDVLVLLGTGALMFAGLVLVRPYVMERILEFIDPGRDPLGSSYQVQQSLIAIGSGGFFGRGFGQSIQKFSFLPEPIGDSIFAVLAEEFGFIGSFALIALFLFFAFRGLRIASRSPDYFSGLLVIGIVILIVSQSFINIASMLGIFPLTGVPLLFVSHGGSALFAALLGVGIILNVSKYERKRA